MPKPKLKKSILTTALTVMLLSSIMFFVMFFVACGMFSTTYHSFPHLISEDMREASPIRPIDSRALVVNFRSHNNSRQAQDYQLWEILDIIAVQNARPNLDCPYLFSEVRQSYLNARQILNQIILNDFTDHQRLLAIHDFLSYKVEYDYELFERFLNPAIDTTQEVADSLSFDIRGVFLDQYNRVAVCEGLSKALMLMAGIEGIQARVVKGSFNDGRRQVQHMWNKVRAATDGVYNWYNIDVTLNNHQFYVGGVFSSQTITVLNHGFFMRSDRALHEFGGHRELPSAFQRNGIPIPQANGEYDFFSTRYFNGIDGLSMIANNADELVEIFTTVANQNRRVGAIQVKLNFFAPSVQIQTNDLAVFAPAIERAYGAIRSDFNFTRGQTAAPPFAQYPGGVFVFMIFS